MKKSINFRILLTLCCLILSSWGHAAPTLSPSSGVISESGQVFTYAANGTDVSAFWVYVGTSPSGASSYSHLNSGGLGPADSSISTALLPDGQIYFTLWYQVSGTWLSDVYTFEVEGTTTGAALLAELGCGDNELIQSTPDGWECVPSTAFQGVEGPQGPQGPEGQRGPVGPAVTSVSACSTSTQAYAAGRTACASVCGGSSKVIVGITEYAYGGGANPLSVSCRVMSDNGECVANGSSSNYQPRAVRCCSCSP